MVAGVLQLGEAGHSPFEPRAFWTYRIVALELLATAILLPALGFRLSPAAAAALPLWAFLLCGSAMLLRRYGHIRLSGTMEAIGLVYGQGFAILFLLFPLTAISLPLADAQLAAADRWLGFDWPTFAALFAQKPFAQSALVVVYHSFNWQPLLVILALAKTQDRCWQFITAATISALVVAILYPFAPAVGAFFHYGVNPADFPRIESPWQFGPIVQNFKGGQRSITPDTFTGMVSFPSYHAAAGTIFAWAMWRTRFRWVFVALNVGLCGSAMIVGGHYLIDILAGCAIGVASVFAAAWAVGGLATDEGLKARQVERSDDCTSANEVRAGG